MPQGIHCALKKINPNYVETMSGLRSSDANVVEIFIEEKTFAHSPTIVISVNILLSTNKKAPTCTQGLLIKTINLKYECRR